MRSIESLFNDSHWEVRIPNARIDNLSEDYKAVIQAKPRTHVFYGTSLMLFLLTCKPLTNRACIQFVHGLVKSI